VSSLAWIPTDPYGPTHFPEKGPLFPAFPLECYRVMLS
jgi:hypothetical protein